MRERDHPTGGRIAWVRAHDEPELRHEPSADVLPAATGVARAVDAAMVLLVERLGLACRHDELVHTLPGLGVRVGREAGSDPAISSLPGGATIFGGERPDRADRDPHPLRVAWMGNDRVADEAARARLPAGTARVVAQARDVRPGLAAVVAPEQASGLGPGPDRPVGTGDVPDRRDLRAIVAVGQPFGGMGPGRAEILASEDGRSVPGRSAGGE